MEEVQQDRNAVGGPLLLLSRPARIQNHRETLAVGRQTESVIASCLDQLLPGPHLEPFRSKGISRGDVADHHDTQIRSKEKSLHPSPVGTRETRLRALPRPNAFLLPELGSCRLRFRVKWTCHPQTGKSHSRRWSQELRPGSVQQLRARCLERSRASQFLDQSDRSRQRRESAQFSEAPVRFSALDDDPLRLPTECRIVQHSVETETAIGSRNPHLRYESNHDRHLDRYERRSSGAARK